MEPIGRDREHVGFLQKRDRFLDVLQRRASSRLNHQICIGGSERSQPLRLTLMSAHDQATSSVSRQRANCDCHSPALHCTDSAAVPGDEDSDGHADTVGTGRLVRPERYGSLIGCAQGMPGLGERGLSSGDRPQERPRPQWLALVGLGRRLRQAEAVDDRREFVESVDAAVVRLGLVRQSVSRCQDPWREAVGIGDRTRAWIARRCGRPSRSR